MKNSRGRFSVRFLAGCIFLALLLAALFAGTAVGIVFAIGFDPTTAFFISLVDWGLLLNLVWTSLSHGDDATELNLIRWPARIIQVSTVLVFSFVYAAWACWEIPDNAREICGVGFLMGIAGLASYGIAGIVGSLIGVPIHKALIRKNARQIY